MRMLSVGELAPDFELSLYNGEKFRLSERRGKQHVVLYFYPKDFTRGCIQEACTFQNHSEEIHKLGAALVGVSADSLDQHREFARAYHLDFPLASDPTLEVCRSYAAVGLGGLRIKRITYVIDKKGVIRGSAHHEIFIEKHWEVVADVLQRLQEQSR